MAEKAFKVPSLSLIGSLNELAVNVSTNKIEWQGIQSTETLASESYVDNAVSNATVNVNALAGDGLVVSGNSLQVNPGTGLYLTGDAVAVNTNAIAGDGLSTSMGQLTVNPGSGIYIISDAVAVNTNAIAGDGLSTSMGQLTVNPGTGLYLTGDAVAVNTNVIATVAYVDAVAEGLHIHESVRAATTTNVDLANALENGDTLDGITLATNDRILVKNQTTQSENGIYVVQASGQPSRATDFDTATEVDSGDFVFVREGTVNASTGWVQTSTPAVIGTDPITFTQFSGAGTYTAGDGLSLNGNQFSVLLATTGNNPAGLKFDSGVLQVKTGSGLYIDNGMIAAGALAVNTNAIASSLAGSGLTNINNVLDVNLGTGLYISNDPSANQIAVNVNSIAGDGLTTNTGQLTVNPGAGIYLTGDTVAVNVNAIAGNGLTVSGNTIVPNVGSSLYVDGMINTLNVNTSVVASNLGSENYGAASFFIANDGATAKTIVGRQQETSAYSDEWITVATLDYGTTGKPYAFEAFVTVSVGTVGSDPSQIRSSKLSGIFVGGGSESEYTEYAIVESGGSISGVDVRVNSSGDIQAKASVSIGDYIRIVAEAKTLAS